MTREVARSKVDTLRSIPLFGKLSSSDLAFLASHMDEVNVPAGRVLIQQGQPNHAFYVIVEGDIDVEVGGEHRRGMGPGDFFGEISMLEVTTPATATVTARTPLQVLVVSHSQFRALEGNEKVLFAMRTAMGQHLLADRPKN
ncbi:MAG: cyclic nucleotide-binding domain-containing protein [Chloroflexi bacterium]|nr:MAG: cyclic nucleotide-binding domain-containing protein [Chloroflexota bacterium]TME14399.1 MAG: cyclic nucleotide-binding domain-containing protein [Chloroflexota bacterium]TME15645.1 MAG: cyclic nucleotide-binding domain-containing protein [Chloroflexota bacterium]